MPFPISLVRSEKSVVRGQESKCPGRKEGKKEGRKEKEKEKELHRRGTKGKEENRNCRTRNSRVTVRENNQNGRNRQVFYTKTLNSCFRSKLTSTRCSQSCLFATFYILNSPLSFHYPYSCPSLNWAYRILYIFFVNSLATPFNRTCL